MKQAFYTHNINKNSIKFYAELQKKSYIFVNCAQTPLFRKRRSGKHEP